MHVDADDVHPTPVIMSVGDECGDDQFGVDTQAPIDTTQLIAEPARDNRHPRRGAPVQG